MMLLMYPKWAHQYFNLSMIDTQERILGSNNQHQLNISNNQMNINASTQKYAVLEEERL